MGTVETIYARNASRKIYTERIRERPVISMANRIIRKRSTGKKFFILEFKRQSPSGFKSTTINDPESFKERIAIYGDAISVLTEPDYFKGSIDDAVPLQDLGKPILMKDFIDRKSMIDMAYISGFDSYLLIADFLGREKLDELCKYGMEKGMEPLVEFHHMESAGKIPDDDRIIIGYNRRNLKTLTMEPDEERALSILKGRNNLKVLESGMNSSNLRRSLEMDFDAYLIGTSVLNDQNFLNEIKETGGNYYDE